MTNHSLPLYQYPQVTWDAEKCAKYAKRTARDGMGTKHPYKGYIGDLVRIGIERYNGGIEIGEDGLISYGSSGKTNTWWQGIEFPKPQIVEGFELFHRTNWGWYIRSVV